MATDERTPAQKRRDELDAKRAADAEAAAKSRGFKPGNYVAKMNVSHDGIDYLPGEEVSGLTAVQVEQLAAVDAIEMPAPAAEKAKA